MTSGITLALGSGGFHVTLRGLSRVTFTRVRKGEKKSQTVMSLSTLIWALWLRRVWSGSRWKDGLVGRRLGHHLLVVSRIQRMMLFPVTPGPLSAWDSGRSGSEPPCLPQ